MDKAYAAVSPARVQAQSRFFHATRARSATTPGGEVSRASLHDDRDGRDDPASSHIRYDLTTVDVAQPGPLAAPVYRARPSTPDTRPATVHVTRSNAGVVQRKAQEPREVQGKGGYVYKQYPDGAIEIVAGPSSKGAKLTRGPAWQAITREIGPYPAATATPAEPAATSGEADAAESSFLDQVAALGESLGEGLQSLLGLVVGGDDASSNAPGGELADPATYLDASKKSIYGSKGFDAAIGRVRYGKIQNTKFEDDAAYYKALDQVHEERKKSDDTAITASQEKLLQMARKAAQDDTYLDALVKQSKLGTSASVDYSGAMVQNGQYTLNPELQRRMARFHRFTVAVGLYKASLLKIGPDAALRSQTTAHRWAVEHMIVTAKRSNVISANLQDMYADQSYRSGEDVIDAHGTAWAKASHFVDAEGKPAEPGSKTIDGARTFQNVKQLVDGFNLRNNKKSVASEGYLDKKSRLPNPADGEPYQSPHIVGEAIDRDRFQFIDGSGSDPIIDYIAWEFGLVRRAAGEQWHFELTGRPVRQETLDEDRALQG